MDDHHTGKMCTTGGVPQGSVLGPILFVIYINILIEVVDNSELFLIADDNKLFNDIFKDDNSVVLQARLM